MFLAVSDLPEQTEWIGEPRVAVVVPVLREVDDLLMWWDVPCDVAAETRLVAEVLLWNVVEHAQTTFRLVVLRRGLLLYVGVEDGCLGARPARHLGLWSEQGHGLRLLGAMASRWGWDECETGKTVWAELLLV